MSQAEELVVHGAREHNLKNVTVRIPRNALVVRDRPLGLREVLARVRHDLRGGSAAVRRVALRIRAPVPADDGEARRRLDRRALAGDLHRPEDDLAQPALDGRHGHGDLRLPAAAVCAHRPAALPDLRAPDRGAVARPDRRAGAAPRRRHEVHGERSGRARPQGRVQGHPGGAAPRRLHAREGRRRAAAPRGGDRPRQEVQAHDRGRRRPARDEGRSPAAAHAVRRDGDVACRGARGHRRRRRRRAHLLREPRVPRSRRLAARARAARVLVQLAARSMSPLHRARRAARDRPRSPRSRYVALDRGGRARPVDDRKPELLRLGDRGDRGALRDPARRAVARARDRAAGSVPARDGGREDLRDVPQPDGPEAPVHDGVRGSPQQPAAALPRDGLVACARPHRGVHELPTVPGVPRRAAQAGGARRDDRRSLDPRVHADVGCTCAPVRRRAPADEDRGAHRSAHPQGGARAAHVPRERRRRLPPARPGGEDALRRRGSAVAAGDADRVAARRRPLHPRRAVDRAAPARQRTAHRHAREAPRRRQHRPRRRARRADDARVRLGGRPRAWRGRARRRDRRRGCRGDDRGHSRLGHGGIPERQAPDPRPAEARGRRARLVLRPRRVDAQPEGHRRRLPGRAVHRRDRCLGLGEVDARERDPLQVAREPAEQDADEAGRPRVASTGSTSSTRSSTSTRARSGGRRARIRRRTPTSSRTCASSTR